jgi:hypothetical protein
MRIVEYKLHVNHDGTTQAPSWVENGGHYYDPDNYTFISANQDVSEFYVPDSIVLYDIPELKTRVLNIHSRYPLSKKISEGPTPASRSMTNEEVEADVDEWVTANS